MSEEIGNRLFGQLVRRTSLLKRLIVLKIMKQLSHFFKGYLCCCFSQTDELGIVAQPTLQPTLGEPFSSTQSVVKPGKVAASRVRLKEWLDRTENQHLVPRLTNSAKPLFKISIATGDNAANQSCNIALYLDYDKQLVI